MSPDELVAHSIAATASSNPAFPRARIGLSASAGLADRLARFRYRLKDGRARQRFSRCQLKGDPFGKTYVSGLVLIDAP